MSLETDPKAAARDAKLLQHERDGIARRITKLRKSGRIPPVTERALLTALNTVNLSLDKDATLAPNALLAKIEAYEELPADANGFDKSRVDLSHATPVPLDRRETDKPPQGKEAAKIADELLATARSV